MVEHIGGNLRGKPSSNSYLNIVQYFTTSFLDINRVVRNRWQEAGQARRDDAFESFSVRPRRDVANYASQ